MYMKLLQAHKGLLSFLLLVVIASVVAVACQGDTQNAQTNQTQQNLTQINAVQQVPNVTYSQRLQVLFDYYGQVLNRPRLRTCTLLTARGGVGASQDAVIGVANSLGMPVNLSNQTTAPTDTS